MNEQNNMDQGNQASQNGAPNPSAKEKNTLMGIFCYLGPLVIVPFLTYKEDPFVKFHARQGMVLLAIEVITWILGMFFYFIWPLINLLNLATFVLSIIGIINVTQGKEKMLPVVGKYSSHIKV